MGIFDGQDRIDPSQNREDNAHLERVASQQWQQPNGFAWNQQGSDNGQGAPQTVYQNRPGFQPGTDYSSQGGPTTQYQQRPQEWQNTPPTQRYPVSPYGGGRAGYGVSGTIPTDNGGTTTVQQPGQGAFVPRQQYGSPEQNSNPYINGNGQQMAPERGPDPNDNSRRAQKWREAHGQPGNAGSGQGYNGSDNGSYNNGTPKDTSPFNLSQFVDWAAAGTGTYFSHKRFVASMPDIGYPSLATQNKLAKPMNEYLNKSEAYQNVLSDHLQPLSKQLEQIGQEKGITESAAKLASNPSFETSLSTTEKATLGSYKQVATELGAVKRYHGLVDNGLADIKIMPPQPALAATEFNGVAKTIATDFGASTQTLGTELKSALAKQESAASTANLRNLGTLGGGLLLNYAIDRHWYAGDKPSMRTDIVDGLLPFIALVPKGNMLVKIGAMGIIHGIAKGLDHEDQKKLAQDR